MDTPLVRTFPPGNIAIAADPDRAILGLQQGQRPRCGRAGGQWGAAPLFAVDLDNTTARSNPQCAFPVEQQCLDRIIQQGAVEGGEVAAGGEI